jgi:hypothetical protein
MRLAMSSSPLAPVFHSHSQDPRVTGSRLPIVDYLQRKGINITAMSVTSITITKKVLQLIVFYYKNLFAKLNFTNDN